MEGGDEGVTRWCAKSNQIEQHFGHLSAAGGVSC